MKNFRILSVILAAALVTVACDKDNTISGGGENVISDPNTCTVSFENIADLDITKTTWVITGEKATEAQWHAMLDKMAEVQATGKEVYGTIDVVMPDITECPKIGYSLRIDRSSSTSSAAGDNNVIKAFSAPNMVVAGYYMLSACKNMTKAYLPKIKRGYDNQNDIRDYIIGLVHECRALKELDVSSVEYTANHFAYFSGLEEIHLPSVTKLQGNIMGNREWLSGLEHNIKIYLTTTENITTVSGEVFSHMPEGTVVYVATEANKNFVENVLKNSNISGSSILLQSGYVTVELLTE